MALPLDDVRAQYPALVPMVATLGLEVLDLTPDRSVMLLPDAAAYRNHVGGPHAGAMFTLAESASGILVLAAFGDLFDEATPFPVEATIRFLKVARGPVTAVASLGPEAAHAVATLRSGSRPEFPVEVELTTGEGEDRLVTGAMTVLWTLRPTRR